MLVLSRKKNESIQIGDDIQITVLEVNSDRIRLGISAPREVRIMREELVQTDVERSSVGSDTADTNSSATDAADAVISLAEKPNHGDTLRSGNAHNHTTRLGSRRPKRPR